MKFYVRGRGEFPFDMLRYDACYPSGPDDSAKLYGGWQTEARTICLAATHSNPFTPGAVVQFWLGRKRGGRLVLTGNLTAIACKRGGIGASPPKRREKMASSFIADHHAAAPATFVLPNGKGKIIAAVECADGFLMSVQASAMHYCSPRSSVGPHEKFEVCVIDNEGHEWQPEPLLQDYSGDCTSDGDRIYVWVPVDVIDAVIEKHGGAKSN